MDVAITRQVSRSINNCELTYMARELINLGRARLQHAQYEAVLRDLGLAVFSLPEEPDLPDAVFVEDTAVVLDECAIITRPGAASRRPETGSISRILASFRTLFHIQPPATLDGGDVLQVGRDIYVGSSQRSDTHALGQLQQLTAPFGYAVHPVTVSGCLHLKSAVTRVAASTLLINPAWVDRASFVGVTFVEVDPSEPYAANVLPLGGRVVCSSSFPRTQERLARAGLNTFSLESDELAKAEGALTCCSLILTLWPVRGHLPEAGESAILRTDVL